MTDDGREAAPRIRHSCLNLLLDGIASVLDCLDNNFMRRLLGLRSAPCQALNKRMPMRLPDAGFCTSWASKTRSGGSVATPARVD